MLHSPDTPYNEESKEVALPKVDQHRMQKQHDDHGLPKREGSQSSLNNKESSIAKLHRDKSADSNTIETLGVQ
jgi:hypothetical protein